MTIKEGFNGKPTTIRIHARKESRQAEVWIEQKGLPEVRETLSFVTMNELLDLQDEIKAALSDLIA